MTDLEHLKADLQSLARTVMMIAERLKVVEQQQHFARDKTQKHGEGLG